MTATPFFVDCFLVGYFYSRTGYVGLETFGVWLTLLVLAGVGTLFAQRGLRQSTEPLQSYLSGANPEAGDLTPVTLDEMGELTSTLSEVVKQKEAALSELQEVQRNAKLGTWKLSGNGVMQLSKEASHILGFQRPFEAQDLDAVTSRLDPEDAEKVRQMIAGEPNAQRPFQITLSVAPNGAEPMTILFSGVPSQDRFNRDVLWSGFLQDVSESVAKERQLLAAQRLESVGKLSGGAAHDFNNLLAVILGNMELLRDGETDVERLGMIDDAIQATQRGSELTRAMLSFARQSDLQVKEIDLNDTVRRMKNWLSRTIPASVEAETSLLAGLWSIRLDPALTENAILNLVLNARDAMPDGGRLTIETANVRIDRDYLQSRQENMETGRYVMLAISDTGAGIPKENLERVFEPFFSTKPLGEGSGMGLSMVEGFMRQSGGTIRVYSEADTGTTIKLYFKAVETTGEAPSPNLLDEEWAVIGAGNKRILLVEDEPEVLNALRKTIERVGYEVLTARSGDEAYRLFADDPSVDLIITDIVMPGHLMGTDLARQLRSLKPELPVVFMSGYASEATVHGNGLRSTDIRLMKPVSRRDLVRAIESALDFS